MNDQPQPESSDGCDGINRPTRFIAISVFAIVTGVFTTVYFYKSMCCDMEMPGGWTMSMMWMQMPGQSWFTSSLSFLVMWLAMMAAMMMPSALPMFLKTRRQWTSLCYMAAGYFTIWLVSGIGIYSLGISIAKETMRSEQFSRIIPLLLGIWLIAGGVIQFTKWKMKHLLRCRSSFGCAVSCPQLNTSYHIGCKQGIECCLCCIAPMTIQLAVGVMNPLVMIAVAIFITAEKLLPRPEITTRLVGFAALFAGFMTIIRGDFL